MKKERKMSKDSFNLKKNKMLKKTKFIIIIVPLLILTFIACHEEDSTDIVQLSWQVKYICVENQNFKVKNKDYVNKEAYILIFKDDSVFQLNTSVNLAVGEFKIPTKNCINILKYQEITEIGGQSIIDKKLLQYIPTIYSYKILGDNLVLQGNNCEIKLKKQ